MDRDPTHARWRAIDGERRLLQAAILIAGLVPVAAGLGGALKGADLIAAGARDMVSADSHIRYLSGLLLGIGLVAWSLVPSVERQGQLFGLIAALVAVGGLARLLGLVANGPPGRLMLAALAMELVVTPALALWQRRVGRLWSEGRATGAPVASGGDLP